jgi:F-type H+-transporting ATPase subunit b
LIVLINWFTVFAQIVNFLILVVLLKYFLYDRIIRAMDERERRIRAHLEEAERKKEEAKVEAESFRAKNREFEEKREDMLSQVKTEADGRRTELIQQTRTEIDHLRKRWQGTIQRERESFIRELRLMATRQVYAVARRALEDLADENLEVRAIEVFISELRKQAEASGDDLAEFLSKSEGTLTVTTAFEIPDNTRKRIIQLLRRHASSQVDVTYEASSNLILGIELQSQGRRISWSLDNYLETLEDSAREALENEAHTHEAESTTHAEPQSSEGDRA